MMPQLFSERILSIQHRTGITGSDLHCSGFIMTPPSLTPCEHSGSHWSARRAAWVVMGLIFSTGCRSLATTLRDDSASHQYAVDLNVEEDQQSSPATSSEFATAQADYGQLKSRTVSQQDDGSSAPAGFTAGHSFAPRRAVLRQPIPLTDREEPTVESDVASAKTNPSTASAIPKQPTVAKTAPVSSEPELDSTPAQDDSFWSSGGGVSAWRPDAQGANQRPRGDRLRLGNATNDRPSATSGDRQVGTGTTGTSLPTSPSSKPPGVKTPGSQVNSSDSRASVAPSLGSAASQNVNSEAVDSGDVLTGAASPVPSATKTDGTSEPASESTTEDTPATEPGVLERLRGLYAPRPSDAEKFRKQMRRLSDPFGLLKERDEDAGPTTPIEGTVEGQTAEVTEPAVQPVENIEKTLDIRQLLETAIAQAETDLEEWPRTPSGRPDRPADWRRRQTDLRLMYLVAGRSADSVKIIESLPEEEQEFWQSLMLAMHSYRSEEGTAESDQRLLETLDHVRTAEKRLQPLAQLKIRRAVFCERINGFGQVAEFPASDFDPGQRVLIYVDVRNFQTELSAQGRFRSEFDAVIEYLREDDGEVMDTIRLPQIQDECDVERTDYFQSFELTIPALAGRYVARVRLKDLLNQQTTEVDLPFTVRSQQSGL